MQVAIITSAWDEDSPSRARDLRMRLHQRYGIFACECSPAPYVATAVGSPRAGVSWPAMRRLAAQHLVVQAIDATPKVAVLATSTILPDAEAASHVLDDLGIPTTSMVMLEKVLDVALEANVSPSRALDLLRKEYDRRCGGWGADPDDYFDHRRSVNHDIRWLDDHLMREVVAEMAHEEPSEAPRALGQPKDDPEPR